MPLYRFTWQTVAPLQELQGRIEVRAENEIRGYLFARRCVRDKRLPGFDLAHIVIEREQHGRTT